VPVPVRVACADGFDALLVNDALADATPLDCGLKLMVNEMLLPAASVTGRDNPLTVNSEVLILAPVTVMLDPVAVSEPVRLLLCPTTTLPKLRVLGPTANCPETVAVPLIAIETVGLDASETREINPVALPPIVGANTVPKVKLCPGLKVSGRLNPVILNPVPDTAACDRLTGALPVLVIVSDSVLELPTATLEKSRLESLVLNAPRLEGLVELTAVAVTGTFTTGFEPSVVTATVPVEVPVD